MNASAFRPLPAVVAFASGTLFAVGLGVSGMTKPSKVVGFLDVFGDWDPSLAIVMAGAVGVHSTAYHLFVRGDRSPWFAGAFDRPIREAIDRPLVAGAAIFGIGWGIGGLCPGPALVAVAGGGGVSALVFMIGMTIGIFAESVSMRRGAELRAKPSSSDFS